MAIKDKKPNKNRKPGDELESLREIVSENQGLYLRVMDFLKKAQKQDSIFDVASKKQKTLKKKTDD